jgi:hypothetical protein
MKEELDEVAHFEKVSQCTLHLDPSAVSLLCYCRESALSLLLLLLLSILQLHC